jgi:2-hydroxy-3-keto-5-methylthiopentenyl-1-phosphate phosphatase
VIETLQGRKAEAIEDFEKAFKIDPSLRETFKEFVNKRLSVTPP